MRRITIMFLFLFLTMNMIGQYQSKVKKEIRGENGKPQMVVFGKSSGTKATNQNAYPKVSEAKQVLKGVLNLKDDDSFEVKSTSNDSYGKTHLKYQQYYKGLKVEFGEYFIHAKGGDIHSINGEAMNVKDVSLSKFVSKETAIKKAIKFVGAKQYIWNKDASKYPKAEELIVKAKRGAERGEFVLAYKVNVYSTQPLNIANYYVSAATGEIVDVAVTLHNAKADGQADTRYSGRRDITTDSYNGSYRLRDYSRGNGILTRNLNNREDLSSVTEFTDNDNNWTSAEFNNYKKDNAALEAHWGIIKTYDYFKEKHNRNSYDGNGAAVNVYVHFGQNVDNAFWNPNDRILVFGDGGQQFDALVSIDVAAHELGHAVCSSTANLTYSYESGALNEGLSDIWGASVEYYAAPEKDTWKCGEDLGNHLRDLSNPKSKQQPDTYKGQYWVTGSQDNGGVHTNSGVINHWYYLICEGGSGTNDNNDSYQVEAIGMANAERIVYQAEANYMTSSTNYAGAREDMIQAAVSIFGEGSKEEISVTNAWYAVGVGDPYDGDPNTGGSEYCTSKGNNSQYEWISKFELGSFTNTSGASGYTFFENQTVELIAGQATTIRITPSFDSGSYTEFYKVWIDLNGDTTFSENELVFDPGSSSSAVSGTITIPAGTGERITRMRVSMKYNGAQTACESFEYGEVEDYNVHFSSNGGGLSAPQGLTASNITFNSATVSWQNVNGATAYDVEIRPLNGNWTSTQVSNSTYNVTGLAESTDYEVRVRAKNATETSDYSSTLSFKTKSQTTPDLDPPTGLTSSNISTTGFTVSWNSVQNATSYKAEIKLASGSNWTSNSTNSTSYSFTNLAPGTQYNVRVSAVNSQTESDYSSILTVTTQEDTNPSEYCTSAGENSSYFWINDVYFNDLYNSSGDDGGYGDYTGMTANIQKGTTTSLYFRAGYSGYSYLVYWSAWIDYNQNGTFESSEQVASGSSSSTGYLVEYINVPTTAFSGTTRLRISMKYGAEASSCETFQYGEVEDYTVNISDYGYNGFSADNHAAMKLGNENQSPELKVYPNPALDKIKLIFAQGIESQVEIINASGKTMLSKSPSSNDFEVNITDFPAGLYYVRYNNGLEMRVSKFIKR